MIFCLSPDLYVRIYGHDVDDVNEAKAHVLADFGPSRVSIQICHETSKLTNVIWASFIRKLTSCRTYG